MDIKTDRMDGKFQVEEVNLGDHFLMDYAEWSGCPWMIVRRSREEIKTIRLNSRD